MKTKLTRILATSILAAVSLTSLSSLEAKDKGKGQGNGKGPKNDKHVEKFIKSAAKSSSRDSSAFAPGRSLNLPPGHGGVPPGQLKKVAGGITLERYRSIPRSDYALTLGDGYAGRGYYYGPRDVPYFYEAPHVQYYRNRELAPREYWNNSPYQGDSGYDQGGALNAGVQSALARRGYYRGPVDGDIGPGSRAAIAQYQSENGLPVTGRVDSRLLSSLGLY